MTANKTIEEILYEYRWDTESVNNDLVLQQRADVVERFHRDNNFEATKALNAHYLAEVLDMIEELYNNSDSGSATHECSEVGYEYGLEDAIKAAKERFKL